MEEIEELSTKLGDRLTAGDPGGALSMLTDLRAADAADVLEFLDDEVLAELVERWEPQSAASVLSELVPSAREALADRIPSHRLADFLDAMPPDDAADFLGSMEPEARARILGRMEREEASDVAELLDYPQDSAGRAMSQDFFAVGEDFTAQQVIDSLRRVPEEIELIYYIYVLGGSEQLKGVVSLRRLITAPAETPVSMMMETDLVTVSPTDDEETVADLIGRYNLIAVPVADEFGRMLGIITVDDVLERMGEGAEEDVLRFAGSIEEEPAISRAWPALRRRLPWLGAAAIVELLIAYLLLRPLPAALLLVMVAYVPLLVFVGGNTAVQAAARVLVRLDSGAEAWSSWVQVRKELDAGILLAFIAGVLSLPLLMLLGRGWALSLTVSLALTITVVLAAGMGATLPVLLKKMRLDPAIVSGPLLGSAMDIISLSVYLTLGIYFFRILV